MRDYCKWLWQTHKCYLNAGIIISVRRVSEFHMKFIKVPRELEFEIYVSQS